MSRRNYFQDPQNLGEPVLGVDSTTPTQAVKPGFVVSAKNVRPGLEGGWIKRDGYTTVLDTAYGSRDITGGIEFKTSAGSRTCVVFGTDGTGTGGRYGKISGGAVSDITTGLSGTARPSFVQFQDLLFFFNGSDAPEIYDGSTTYQVGITAPAAAPTESAQGTSGNLVQLASYVYAYTYYNSTTGAESSPSEFLTVTLTGSNDDVTLGLTAGDSATADTINIYRTVANGNTLFFEDTEAIGATSHASTASDDSLTTQMELDNTRITTYSASAKYPVNVRSRLFLRTADNELRYSKIGQSGPMPQSFEANSFTDTTGTFGAADKIVGIAKSGETPIVLKERSIGALREVGIPDFNSATDNVAFVYDEISDEVGGVSHWAWTQVLGECIFLGRDNIYGTRGQKGDLRPLADPIQSDIKGYGFSDSQVEKVSAINDTKNRLVYFQVFTSSAAADPKYVIVGDYRKYPQFRWSFYTPGSNEGTHPGIVAGSYMSVTNSSDGSRDIYFGNIDGNGELYNMNDGTNDDGSGIYAEIQSRPYDADAPFADKLYKDGFFYAKGNGNDYSLTIASIFDLSGEEASVKTVSLFAGGALWDTAEWDDAEWTSNAAPSRKYQIHRKAQQQQLVFRQTDADAPLTLFSWSTTGSRFRVF